MTVKCEQEGVTRRDPMLGRPAIRRSRAGNEVRTIMPSRGGRDRTHSERRSMLSSDRAAGVVVLCLVRIVAPITHDLFLVLDLTSCGSTARSGVAASLL